MPKAAAAILAACCMGVGAAHAEVPRVEAVQSPAWLERGGHTVPLAAGTALQRNDRIRTGDNARVRLRLPEGSAIKLGEQAGFVVERSQDRDVFRGSFAVLAGAFRFTTQALAQARPRDVSIRVKSVSIGIRGTDVWGKSSEERDVVCLIEGRVVVGAAGHRAVSLERPLDSYLKPRDGAPEVARVDAQQLEAWAQETEVAGDAAARAADQWRVVAASAADRESARVLQRRLRAAGFPADIVASEGYLQLHLSRLGSEAQARAVMGNLRGIPGITLPKVVPDR